MPSKLQRKGNGVSSLKRNTSPLSPRLAAFRRYGYRFDGRHETTPPYAIDKTFFDRVDWAIEQAHARNLVVILNLHHYRVFSTSPKEHKERFLALWKQLAEHYRNHPGTLYFEILNEPGHSLTADLWNTYAAEAIRIIRKTNPSRAIVVGPAQFNNLAQLKNLKLPREDKNLIVTFHYYSPFKFTHQGASWAGARSHEWIGTTWSGTGKEKRAIAADLDLASEWAEANGFPLFMGEFGSYEKGDIQSRAAWTAFVRSEAEKRNISWSYWEFGAGFGLYDPARKTWRTPLRDALLPNKKNTIKILSYNIHHGAGIDGTLDLERIAQVIKAANPDIVSLQEVDNQTRRSKGIDQAKELARLTDMQHAYGASMDFAGGKYGNAILTKHTIARAKTIPLPGEPRSALCARIKLSGKTVPSGEFLFIATHLDTSKAPRIDSVPLIESLFESSPNRPAIIAGDFNATPKSPTMAAFGQTWKNATSQENLFTFPVAKPSKQIDYILSRPADRWKVVSSEVLAEAVASDHRPILAELEFVRASE